MRSILIYLVTNTPIMKNYQLLFYIFSVVIFFSCQEHPPKNVVNVEKHNVSVSTPISKKYMVIIVEYRTPKLSREVIPQSEYTVETGVMEYSIKWDSLLLVSAIKEIGNDSAKMINEEVEIIKNRVESSFNDFVFLMNISGVVNPKTKEMLKKEGHSQITSTDYYISENYDNVVAFCKRFSNNPDFTNLVD